jgi:hypothetical protein
MLAREQRGLLTLAESDAPMARLLREICCLPFSRNAVLMAGTAATGLALIVVYRSLGRL